MERQRETCLLSWDSKPGLRHYPFVVCHPLEYQVLTRVLHKVIQGNEGRKVEVFKIHDLERNQNFEFKEKERKKMKDLKSHAAAQIYENLKHNEPVVPLLPKIITLFRHSC